MSARDQQLQIHHEAVHRANRDAKPNTPEWVSKYEQHTAAIAGELCRRCGSITDVVTKLRCQRGCADAPALTQARTDAERHRVHFEALRRCAVAGVGQRSAVWLSTYTRESSAVLEAICAQCGDFRVAAQQRTCRAGCKAPTIPAAVVATPPAASKPAPMPTTSAKPSTPVRQNSAEQGSSSSNASRKGYQKSDDLNARPSKPGIVKRITSNVVEMFGKRRSADPNAPRRVREFDETVASVAQHITDTAVSPDYVLQRLQSRTGISTAHATKMRTAWVSGDATAFRKAAESARASIDGNTTPGGEAA